MKGKFHGITSLLLISTSFIIGLYATYLYSLIWAIIYGITLLSGMLSILFCYCAKCPCKETNCGHYFPGKLTRLFPNRTPGKYKVWEKLGVFLPVILIIAIPQFWLFKNYLLLAIYWGLFIIGFIQIKHISIILNLCAQF